MQRPSVLFPDVELEACGYLRTALAGRVEAYTDNVGVANDVSRTTKVRKVIVRRDGGPQNGLFDYPRLTIRVFADVEQEASDLARMVQALMVAAPGTGSVCGATVQSGPIGIPESGTQFQKSLTVEWMVRGTNL